MRRSARLLAAIELAIERDAELLDRAAGLREVTITIELDPKTGLPSVAVILPRFQHYIVSRPLNEFTFEAT